jgi:hypothetical protein
MANEHRPASWCPRNEIIIRDDTAGWISGSSGSEVETIGEFLHLYGERWQLEEHPAFHIYVAVHRPTPTSQHVIVAERITELAAKVAAAEAAREDDSRLGSSLTSG